ncbi:MAG: tRNA threonylcarbamoyladenosine dehydratase [Clostridia bacterium]|nr:tRNA threonylcarbamoyladenosine dehydratase [Clostridia bacterium]
MLSQFSRTELMFGKDSTQKLKECRVAVFGIGGVGGTVVESLARSGVGTIDIIDNDTVSLTNINRQIIALNSNVGKFKVDVMEERIKDICPDITVNKYKCFFLPETSAEFDFSVYDYVVDAIDTVKGKIEIVEKAKQAGARVICAMGAGNKTDPTKFEVTDIYKTHTCPLAKVMRSELKKRDIESLKVVYSTEKAVEPDVAALDEFLNEEGASKRSVPGSNPFVPPVCGYIIAGEVIKDLIGKEF